MRMVDDAKDEMLHHAILVITTGVAFSPSTRSTGTQPLTAAHPSYFFFFPFMCACVRFIFPRFHPGPVCMRWQKLVS